jgi:nitrate/TMAO reductase-like tetraheme cytochrome c subunit
VFTARYGLDVQVQCRLILPFKGLGTVAVSVVMNTPFSQATHTHTHTHNHCEVCHSMSRFQYEYCRAVTCVFPSDRTTAVG